MHIDAISNTETILHLSFHQLMPQILLPTATAGSTLSSATAHVGNKKWVHALRMIFKMLGLMFEGKTLKGIFQ